MTEEEADLVFQALANEIRRAILDSLRQEPGQPVGRLARQFDVSRIAVMNHLTVLERAGLVHSERDGRKRRLYLNAAPIHMIHDRWISDYSAYWASRLTELKYAAEQTAGTTKGSSHD